MGTPGVHRGKHRQMGGRSSCGGANPRPASTTRKINPPTGTRWDSKEHGGGRRNNSAILK